MPEMNITTPDGRKWIVERTSTDGHRLFELDAATGKYEEHDAPNDVDWNASDLIDYLAAVGKNGSN